MSLSMGESMSRSNTAHRAVGDKRCHLAIAGDFLAVTHED